MSKLKYKDSITLLLLLSFLLLLFVVVVEGIMKLKWNFCQKLYYKRASSEIGEANSQVPEPVKV